METPSSTRRITRSQAAAAVASANSREKIKRACPFSLFQLISFQFKNKQSILNPEIKSKQDDSSQRARSKNGGERHALLDVTNESPIVGLASGSFLPAEKTPLAAAGAAKSRVLAGRGTPGSGEEVLRGQVRTLLQKVEEETEHPSFAHGQPHHLPPSLFPTLLGIDKTPLQLLAPTPANTPQIPGEGDFVPMEIIIASPFVPSQNDHQKAEEILVPQECQLNRALTFDSPEKSEASDDPSTISSCDSISPEKSQDDDSSSVWSNQVNVCTNSVRDEDVEEEGEEENDELDDLCEGLKKMWMEEEKPRLPEFTGKHTRFVYNSDDEIEAEEAVGESKAVSPSVLVLKGLPVPEGKHLRFQEEDESEE
ncbi:hypothetical protein ZIOFF_041754 [Zingiber officinale]|uniref:Uncharacterized protein n=1 Tax=Zingiber officinale TaxID=94328 RepID=A0A8J5G742_ZINOF|nr:hypothetical protein ZIOFF_041754 [Zingiber officinale]